MCIEVYASPLDFIIFTSVVPICAGDGVTATPAWNKSKSKFTPSPQDITILVRFYKKYVAKQEYFANMANTALN